MMEAEFYHKKAIELLVKIDPESLYTGRINLGSHDIQNKVNFIKSLAVKLKGNGGVINLNVLFWEQMSKINEIFNSAGTNVIDEIEIYDYQGGEKPGQFKLLDIDDKLLETFLTNHLNYEMALNPALNLRLQVYSNIVSKFCLDVYDDRGLDLYMVMP